MYVLCVCHQPSPHDRLVYPVCKTYSVPVFILIHLLYDCNHIVVSLLLTGYLRVIQLSCLKSLKFKQGMFMCLHEYVLFGKVWSNVHFQVWTTLLQYFWGYSTCRFSVLLFQWHYLWCHHFPDLHNTTRTTTWNLPGPSGTWDCINVVNLSHPSPLFCGG